MSALNPLEAYDLICHSAQLEERLSAALALLAKKQQLTREKEWLSTALELVQKAREGSAAVVDRSLGLAELAPVREEHAVELQGRWVDALERLLAGITFHAGSRAPLIEALFPRLKLPALRRAKPDAVDGYAAELEKRLGGSYVKRMLTQDTFAFAGAVIEEVRAAFAPWKASFSGEGLPPEVATAIRAELLGAAEKLELPAKQAKLLAEAAMGSLPGAFEESGIGLKPRKRSVKVEADLPKGPKEPAEEAENTEVPTEAAPVAEQPKPQRKKRAKAPELPVETP